jgi:hypothetical protein
MPSRPGRTGRKPEGSTDPQEQAAADLSDRAAESVERRYDATKEIHSGTREGPERPDDDDSSNRGE